VYHQDEYTLIMLRDMVTLAEAALKKYSPFFKVSCVNTSDHYSLLGLTHDEFTKHAEAQLIPINSRLAFSLTKHPVIPHHNIPSIDWDAILIKQLIPVITPATTQTFLPHELNLEAFHAIAFDKGCYTGQEIIARLHYRSQIQYTLHQAMIKSDDEIELGSDVYHLKDHHKQTVGRIVNSVKIDPQHYQLLLSIKMQTLASQDCFIHGKNPILVTLITE
jgi:hypothetical protein